MEGRKRRKGSELPQLNLLSITSTRNGNMGITGRHEIVAFIVTIQVAEKVDSIDYKNERIISIKINLTEKKVGIVQTYTPRYGLVTKVTEIKTQKAIESLFLYTV